MGKRLVAIAVGVLLWPVLALAQISPTYTFTSGTVINPDEVNANFALLANALNRTGGTMTGTLTTRGLVPNTDATYDLGLTGTKYRDLWLSRNAAVGGTLGVTGAATLSSTLGVTGATTLSSTLGVTGATTLSSTLGVTGAATFSSTLEVTGDSTLGGTTAIADLEVSGDVALTAPLPLSSGGLGVALSDPGGDRIAFWDDSAGSVAWLTAGTNLAISGTTLNASSPYVLTGTAGSPAPAGSVHFDPSDGTTYYVGQSGDYASMSTAGRNRIYIPIAGTITAARFSVVVNSTLGSSETSTVVLRLNNSTDTSLSTAVKADAAYSTISSTGLSVAVSAGDYVEFKWTTPSWATNPVQVSFAWQLVVEP